MIALYILPVARDDGLYYLTEQIIICLLETYRLDAAYLDSTRPHMLRFCRPARYFMELAEEVFRMTGWQGFCDAESTFAEFNSAPTAAHR